jgi:hypothetical protein
MAAMVAATPKRVLNFLHAALQMQRKGREGYRVCPRHMPALGRPLHSRLRRFSRAAGVSLEGASTNVTLLGAFWPPRFPWAWPVAAIAMGVIAVNAKTSDPVAIRPVHPRDSAWDMVSS